jgi:hypothetical protein
MSEQTKPEQRMSLPMSFIQAVANYLGDRPFKEVAHFIAGIEQLGKPVEPDPPKE